MAHAAEASAEYARRVLDGQLLRIDRANDVLAGLADEEIRAREAELHAALRRAVAAGPREDGQREPYVFVYDREARPLVSSNVFPVPRGGQALAQREFNQALRDPGSPPLHVSPVYVGSVTGEPFFAITRRRERTGNGLPAGAYDGVVNASIYVDEAAAALRRIAAPGDVVALVRDDGEVLARSVPVPPGTRLRPDSPMMTAMRLGDARVLVVARSSIDGETRIAAYRRVEGYPVYVSAARPRAAVLRRWAETVLPLLAAGIPATLALLGLALLVRRGQRDLAATNAALERRVAERTAALAASERRNAEVLDSIGEPLCSLDAQGRVTYASASAIEFWGKPAAAVLGRRFDDVFPEGVGSAAWQAKQEAAAQGVEIHLCTVSPIAHRWIELDVHPRPDGGVTVAFRDIHDRRAAELERRRAEAALRASEERLRLAQEAGGVGSWEWNIETGALHWSESCHRLHGTDPATPPSFGIWRAGVHPEDGARVDEALRGTLEGTGTDWEIEYRYIRPADGALRWIVARGRVLRDAASGRALRMRGVALDVTERRQAEERLMLLAREVDHRAKNALAVVQAAVRLAPRDDPEAFARAVEGRVAALARAQVLLAETGWQGASLRAVAEGALAAFLPAGPPVGLPAGADRPGGPQARLEGPEVQLAPAAAQPIALALHELATNAAKYGALSVPGGRIALRWWIEAEAGLLRLDWRESGGPAVAAPPGRRGFGSRVVEATISDQLGGSVERRWEADGLQCRMAMPLARAVAAGSAARIAAAGG